MLLNGTYCFINIILGEIIPIIMKKLIFCKSEWVRICTQKSLWRSQYTLNKAYNTNGVLKAEWNKNSGEGWVLL